MVGSTFGHGNYFPHVNSILPLGRVLRWLPSDMYSGNSGLITAAAAYGATVSSIEKGFE
jgi:hypothetical protein